jgi:hypothetical protein
VRPEVVLAARWRRRANLKSPINSPTTVSYLCFFEIYRLSPTVYMFLAIFWSAEDLPVYYSDPYNKSG